MFTQAGFSHAGIRVGCFARLSKLGKSGIRWCWLIHWPCGDRAWASPSRICWGEQVDIHNVIELPLRLGWGPSSPLVHREIKA